MTYHKDIVSPKNTSKPVAQSQGQSAPAAKPTSPMSYQLGFTSGPTG